jgi:signal transduction histidine kinase
MVAGAGEQGEIEALRQSRSAGADPSIIARAARSCQPVNVPDVTLSPAFLYMPEFPDTKSELAIPMVLGDNLLGVFDIQSKVPNRFGADDLTVLTTLAEQIAIAVRNAQLFAEAEQARDVAETSNRVKSQFLAAMSHELRTPLNGILNFTQFVSTGMMGPVNERQKELLDKATSNGEHLLGLINDILDISKIESGSLKLFIEPNINVAHILDDVIATGQAMLIGKPVMLDTHIEIGLPPVTAEARRVRQILLNLVSNACKFTDEGNVTITVRRQGDEILFIVKDTGPGIAPEEQATVFEVFRATETGLRRGEGVGLGIPISNVWPEALGGRLWMESTPGRGSTFMSPCRSGQPAQHPRSVGGRQ